MKKSGYLDMYFDKEAHKYGLVIVYDDGSRSDFIETGTKLEMLNKEGKWIMTELVENDFEYGLEGYWISTIVLLLSCRSYKKLLCKKIKQSYQ